MENKAGATKKRCKHCGVEIKFLHGRFWHDSGIIFSQYCCSQFDINRNLLEGKLHEPEWERKNEKGNVS